MRVAGVSYDIDWRTFKKGRSMFFPSLDAHRSWKQDVRPVVRRLKLNVVYKAVVDPKSGIRGLRIWRV